jgi:hypothetical protein
MRKGRNESGNDRVDRILFMRLKFFAGYAALRERKWFCPLDAGDWSNHLQAGIFPAA